MTGAPDFFALAGLLVRHHCAAVNENDGSGQVNVDTLADDIASRLEAVTLALRLVLATVSPLSDEVLERVVAAIAAAERTP